MDRKPTILLYGNCQAADLHNIMNRVEHLSERFTFKVMLYHHLRTPGQEVTSYSDAFFNGIDIVWEQLGSDYVEERRQFHERLGNRPLIVRFPMFSILTMWPFAGLDKRNLSVDESRRYRIEDVVGAKVAEETAGQNLSDDELFERYMEVSRKRLPNLERRLEIDYKQWRIRDAEADVKVFDFVNDNFRKTRLFRDTGHITAEPERFLLKNLIEASLVDRGAERDVAFSQLDKLLEFNAGMEWAQIPIHPLVADALRLEFYDPDEVYLWQRHELTFKQYTVRYIRWLPYLKQ